MSILESIEGARKRDVHKSASAVAWETLSQEERDAVIAALKSREVGAGKMSNVLKRNGAKISKCFLEKIVDEA